MSRSAADTQGYGTASHIRHSNNHGTSSAFSSSANADEDWTQISDLAERRRIQNRIAQRNYRKKLKKRLEDLERRAGSSSASPPPSQPEAKTGSRKNDNQKGQTKHRKELTAVPRQQCTPPLSNDEELVFDTFERDTSRSPPVFSYTYSAPEDNMYSTYSSYREPALTYTSESHYQAYPTCGPMTLPSMMHITDSIKREPVQEEVSLNPFSLSYATMAGYNVQVSQGYEESAHTPPLCRSFDHSVAGSEIGFENFPSTPLSIPGSPTCLHYI